MALSTARYRILGVEHAAIQMMVAGTPNTIVEQDLHFINNVNFQVQEGNVAFEGDQQSVRAYFINGISAVVRCDTFDMEAISVAFAKSVVTASLPTGVHGRVYFGDTNETTGVFCGFVAQVHVMNLTTLAKELTRWVMPVTQLTTVKPPVLAYNAKAVLDLTFSANKTAVDAAGIALPGVPTDGAYWYVDTLDP